MAKYYWKGSQAGFTTAISGASYTAWINATSTGLTANWAYSVGTVGSGVTGATLLPGTSDTVYISDRFPTLGISLSGVTGSGTYTYTYSPCLNSSNLGITADSCVIGPFSNQSTNGLGLVHSLGYARVGGPTLGNISVTETVGVTATNLVGNPLQLRVLSGILIYDNDLGAYDLNLTLVGTTASQLTISRVVPPSGITLAGAISIATSPWKALTALRVNGTLRHLEVSAGVVLGTLKMYKNFILDPVASGITASPTLRLYGQIFNTELDYSNSANNVSHILVDPNIRCFDVSSAGSYIFGSSVVRTGVTDTLSPQTSSDYADILMKSSKRAFGITSGTITPYVVTLGSNPTEAEPAAVTSQKFATEGSDTGSPTIKILGTVFPMKDFNLPVGRLIIDSTSLAGQQGFVSLNGRVASSQGADFGGLIRLTPVNDDSIEATGVAALHTYASPQARFGIRITADAALKTKYPLNATIETHIDSTYPI